MHGTRELDLNSESDFVMKLYQVYLKAQQDKAGTKRVQVEEIKVEVVTSLSENIFTVGHQCPLGICSSFFYLSQFYEKWDLCWKRNSQ